MWTQKPVAMQGHSIELLTETRVDNDQAVSKAAPKRPRTCTPAAKPKKLSKRAGEGAPPSRRLA
eukprot:4629197-Prorocentrum_lima.AAC.1